MINPCLYFFKNSDKLITPFWHKDFEWFCLNPGAQVGSEPSHFSVHMKNQRDRDGHVYFSAAKRMDAPETSMLSPKRGGKAEKKFQFWHLLHNDHIEDPVVISGRRTETKSSAFIFEIHDRCEIDSGEMVFSVSVQRKCHGHGIHKKNLTQSDEHIDQLAKSKRVEYLFESRCLNSLAYRCVKAHAGADAETPFLVVCYKIWNIYGLYVLF